MMRNQTKLVCLLVAALLTLNTWAKGPATTNAATASIEADHILLQPQGEFESFKVVVAGPSGRFEYFFHGDETPMLDIFSPEGELLADGRYNYEIVGKPMLSEELKAAMADSRNNREELAELLPARAVTSGVFTILQGEFVTSAKEEGIPSLRGSVMGKAEAGGGLIDDTDGGTLDQVFLDDLIVDGSACIGMDCANGENFGFDTLRLKENNLRIKFDDTSSTGSFPFTDWQITVNESDNGGANKFSIDDITNTKTPFTIEANAPNNSLYVADSGDVGIGTSTPVVELVAVDGNTPTLRLEQDGSSGFQTQTWDLAGNETNFFVRDVTNSSKLPFRIEPGASDNRVYIDGNDNVGIGTNNPGASLHVKSGGSNTQLHIEETNAAGTTDPMIKLTNNSSTIISMVNNSTNKTWNFLNGSAGFRIDDNGGSPEFDLKNTGDMRFGSNGGQYLEIASSGLVTIPELTVTTTFTNSSDVNLKEEFQTVDPVDVLNKVAELPITTWEYKHDKGVRHMGVMAQDFYAAFGLGRSDKLITSIDPDGVAMAAIQGLNKKVEEKDAEIASLKERLAALESMVQKLADK